MGLKIGDISEFFDIFLVVENSRVGEKLLIKTEMLIQKLSRAKTRGHF
jgi:hypothetical protein